MFLSRTSSVLLSLALSVPSDVSSQSGPTPVGTSWPPKLSTPAKMVSSFFSKLSLEPYAPSGWLVMYSGWYDLGEKGSSPP